MAFVPASRPGTLHHYTPRLTAFEHQGPVSSASPASSTHHTILFLAGIGDGYLHVTYPSLISKQLPAGWSVCEVLLTSSYTGWTTSSLARDADELVKAVEYFRSLPYRSLEAGARIILMGHSTGCQICMEYLVGPWKITPVPPATLQRPKVDGVILQAGISDREGLADILEPQVFNAGVKMAKEWILADKGNDILPAEATTRIFGADPSAQRWASLAGKEGDDDYFSSDLGDEALNRTFGEIGARKIPICILLSGSDEHIPAFVDMPQLMRRWKQAVRSAGGIQARESGILEGASHNLNSSPADVRDALCRKVCNFADDVAHGRLTADDDEGGRL